MATQILTQGFDNKAVEATLKYIEGRIAPVKEEIKKEVAPIGFVLVFLIVFIVLIPLIAYLIWISVELGLNAWYTTAIIIFVLLISAVMIAIAIYYVSSFLEDTVENALTQLEKYSNETTLNNILVEANNAAGVYLSIIGETC